MADGYTLIYMSTNHEVTEQPLQTRYVAHRWGVTEVHYNGLVYGHRHHWVPANWNGDLRSRYDAGNGALRDTREAAEAAHVEAVAAWNNLSSLEQDIARWGSE